MNSQAKVQWTGPLKTGEGKISSNSGALKDLHYSFRTRFGDEKGTNPEELIAAAHAGCFTMALAGKLGKSGFTVDSIETSVTVALEKTGGEEWSIASSHIDVIAAIKDIDLPEFQKVAEDVKKSCPVSRALKVDVSMSAQLRTSGLTNLKASA